MQKDAFIAKYLDETVGLLVGAFAQHKEGVTHKFGNESWAADGKFMIHQMQRARALLGRIWDDLNQKEKK